MINRRQFLGTVATGAVTGATTSVAVPESGAAESNRLTRTPLVLMAPRDDGFEAVWAVGKLSKGKIEWEAADGAKGVAAADPFGFVPQGLDVLRVRVSGLKPGSSYRVRSVTIPADGGAQETSAWKSFRTLDPDAKTTEFVIWNDTHIHNDTIRKLHEATPGADFLLWNGDTCNNWISPDLLIPTLLHPGERDISEGRPLFLTWGNHDVRGEYAFEMPGLVATPSGRPFYAFRSGPLAAICLHTGEDKPDAHPSFGGRVAFEALRREQAEWLAEAIRRPEIRNAPFRILFCHIPLRWRDESTPDYDRGGFDHFSLRSREAWHDSLVEWKTQLVISGHTHHDAWIAPSSRFPYGQLIGGGPQPGSATWMHGRVIDGQLSIAVYDLQGKTRHEVLLNSVS